MKITETSIAGVRIIEPVVGSDARGQGHLTFDVREYQEALGFSFVQETVLLSLHGVLRGLHLQERPPQAKLVSVSWGEIFDVVVDLREGSPTCGQWTSEVLSGTNGRQLLIPAGCAHGFLVTSSEAVCSIKVDTVNAQSRAIRWDDPTLAIRWPLEPSLLSDRDAGAPSIEVR